MKRVFIGGSRRLSRLNDQVRAKLAEIAERELHVLIGDANGADRAVQAQLAEWKYQNVTVYFVGANPRNNEGAWSLSRIAVSGRKRGFEFYAIKDRQMAHDADCGLMIWDGESRGTLANVQNLVSEDKPVAVYVSKQRRFINVLRAEDMLSLSPALGADIGAKAECVSTEQEELPLGLPQKPKRKRRRRTA